MILNQLTLLEEKRDKYYVIDLRSCRNSWDELATDFKYLKEIIILIDTTNSMESYN